MTSSGVSLQVARCRTWVTPATARSATAAFGDRAAHNLDALARRQHAVVAEGADAIAGMRGIAEQPAHEGLPHLAGGAGDEDEAGLGHGTAVRL